MMHGIVILQVRKQNGEKPSQRNFIVWKKKESGKKQEKQMSQKIEDSYDANESSKSREMVHTEQDLLHWDTVK